ncbi:C40 family peptidase, partial [Mycobacteroides abscessus]
LGTADQLLNQHAGRAGLRRQELLALLARQRGTRTTNALNPTRQQTSTNGFQIPQIKPPEIPKFDLGSLFSSAAGSAAGGGAGIGGGSRGGSSSGLGGVVGSFLGDGSAQSGVVGAAMSKLGTWYLWGGKGRPEDGGRVDCSGLTGFAYRRMGIEIGPDTYTQVNKGVQVSVNDLRKGDLVFSYWGADGKAGPGHVSMVVEDGNRATAKVIQAPQTGEQVKITGVPRDYVMVKRILH